MGEKKLKHHKSKRTAAGRKGCCKLSDCIQQIIKNYIFKREVKEIFAEGCNTSLRDYSNFHLCENHVYLRNNNVHRIYIHLKNSVFYLMSYSRPSVSYLLRSLHSISA